MTRLQPWGESSHGSVKENCVGELFCIPAAPRTPVPLNPCGRTGPVARGDFKVVRADLQALRESPMEIAHAYEALSRLAARVLAQDTAGTLAELEKSSVKMITRAKATGGNA